MNGFRKSKIRQPFATIASTVLSVGLGASLIATPVLAATSSSTATTSTAQSASPYAVLGTVTTTPATLNFDNSHTFPGKTIQFNASSLPANSTLNVVWETFNGNWQIQNENFVGANYTPGAKTLLQVHTDAAGSVTGQFTVPSGHGDAHIVGLVDQQGDVVAAGTLTLSPIATISKSSVAEGQFIHVHVDGLGVRGYTSLYEVIYDNHFLGRVSGVSTGGIADFTVRAEGGVGTHTLQLVMGGMDVPYLNAGQSPYSYRPNYSFVVHVTPGNPASTSDPLPQASPSVGNHLTASIDSGTVGEKFTLSGSGLTPNHKYQLVWNTMAGSRVSGNGYEQKKLNLGSVTTDSSGSFSQAETIPDDLGGPAHTIQLLDGTAVAGDTKVRIYPTVISAPKKVIAGQQFTVDMQGVGWTEYDNIYAASYDNSAIGFVCGFNTQGNVSIQLQASGTPGTHYVDLYPSIWKGTQTLPDVYGVPLLTYVKDHPGDNLPAFHLVFDVLPANDLALAVNGSTGTQYIDTATINGQTAVPLYSVMAALKKLDVTSAWNGHTWAISGTTSSAATSMNGNSAGDLTVTINNNKVLTTASKVRTTPGGSINTTYIPLDTVTQVLQKLGISSNLSNDTWSWSTK